MTAFAKFPKYWLKFIRYSTLKSSSFMSCKNLIENLYVPVVFISLDRESEQNVYSGKFSNVNYEFNVTNVKN